MTIDHKRGSFSRDQFNVLNKETAMFLLSLKFERWPQLEEW